MKKNIILICLLGIAALVKGQSQTILGDLTLGAQSGGLLGYGNRINFEGRDYNGDAIWIARNNTGSNKSELRINIGDDLGQAEDLFAVGTIYWADGLWHPHITVNAAGNVGIGTSIPDAKLAVKGIIHAQEVKVDLSVPGPDYVFANDYKLPTIEQVKSFIKENQHLPEVPSAKEMEANGVNVGEMNMLLLKNIEELTLYVIELKQQLDEVQKKVK